MTDAIRHLLTALQFEECGTDPDERTHRVWTKTNVLPHIAISLSPDATTIDDLVEAIYDSGRITERKATAECWRQFSQRLKI